MRVHEIHDEGQGALAPAGIASMSQSFAALQALETSAYALLGLCQESQVAKTDGPFP